MTYLLQSEGFSGEVLFEFDEDGLLVRTDLTGAVLTKDQKVWFLEKLPRHFSELQEVVGNSRTAKLVKQQTTGVTFEQFWNRYDEKTRSSKKKSLTCWNRLSQTQRDKAFNHISKYFQSLPNGVGVKYAETYLNAELWNN